GQGAALLAAVHQRGAEGGPVHLGLLAAWQQRRAVARGEEAVEGRGRGRGAGPGHELTTRPADPRPCPRRRELARVLLWLQIAQIATIGAPSRNEERVSWPWPEPCAGPSR